MSLFFQKSNLKKNMSVINPKNYGLTFSDKGFTLLEVMVAVAIIAIVLTAVHRLHIQTISMNNASRFYTIAPLLAQNALAIIETSKDNIPESGDFGEDFPEYSWKAKIEDVESEYLGEIAENLKRIDITVFFNKGEYSFGFRTYRELESK